MKPFNLAETRIAERNYCRQHLDRRLRIMVMLALLMLLVAIGSGICKFAILSKEAKVKAQLVDVQTRCINVKKEMSILNSRLGQRKWQKQLAKNSDKWLEIMASILSCIGNDVWLKKIETLDKESTITIDGITTSYSSMSALSSRLKRCRQFKDVRLDNARVSQNSAQPYIDFTFKLKLKIDQSAMAGESPAVNSGQVPHVTESQ